MSGGLLERAVSGVQGLRPYMPGKPVDELERELGISNIIKLASNENPLGPSPLAQAAAQAALSELGRYPDGNGFALRQALAAHHALGAERIVLGNGSNDVLEMIARAFLGPGRNAVLSEYAFAVYPLASQAVGAELRIATALPRNDEMPLGHDLAALLTLVDENTGVVFIANPNNPTGTWLPPSAIDDFLTALPSNVIVVLDEAYFEYMAPELRPDSRGLLEKFANLIVTRTFSKVHGLAALRIGYGLSSAVVIDLLNRVRQPFNTNTVAMAAALASLADQDHVARSVETNAAGMRLYAEELPRMGLNFLPSQGNFLAVDFQREAQPIFDALLREGVILRPMGSYQLPTFLRITIGTEEENQRCLSALRKLLDSDI